MKQKTFLLGLFITTALFADIKKGEEVYKANCAICHTVDGRGALGPDFNMVSYKRTKEEIAAYVKNPYSLSEKFGYSANAMPTLPIEEQEIKDVADYINSLVKFKIWMKKSNNKKKELVKKIDVNGTKVSG
jgi:mono/diheme cytochrome c family protein